MSEVLIRLATQPGDLGWMVMANGELYAREYDWDTDIEALMARIVADFAASHDSRREAAWVAELEGNRAGCVLCVAEDERTARLRILLVEPAARGQGVGGRLVDTCVDFARAAGYERMVLWTNHVLVDARRLYESRGFVLVDEAQHHSFGQDLHGQTWELDWRS